MKSLLLVPAAVLAASIGFLAASCGAGEEATPAGPVPSPPRGDSAATGTEEAPQSTTVEAEAGTETAPAPASSGVVAYQVWFHSADGLFVTYRSEPRTPRVGTAAVQALLAGPDGAETAYGLRSSVPEGTQLLGLTIADGVARVDLTSEFETGGGTASMQMRLAQVVYTLTQFPTVDGVLFSLDGVPIDVLGGEGLIIDHPLSRRDFAELLPVILVSTPALGQEVSSPVLLRGTANVFEANVTVKVLDADGDVLAETFTTATCGTGCRGAYRVQVPFEVASAQDGTIVVHDDDAAGVGRPPHEVRIPVRLVPGS